MSKKLDTLWHLLLYVGLVIGAVAAYLSRFDSGRQFLVLLFLVSFYLIWGVSYHHAKKDVSVKILLEYAAIAFIALGAGYLVLVS